MLTTHYIRLCELFRKHKQVSNYNMEDVKTRLEFIVRLCNFAIANGHTHIIAN